MTFWKGRNWSALNRTFSFWQSKSTIQQTAILFIGLGVLIRVAAWGILPPTWKIHAVFNPLDMPVFDYISNFEGYKPSRMPFFDVFSAGLYIVFDNILGYKALTLFTLSISCLSLPIFYSAVRRLFTEQVALPALTLFALYPKFLFLIGRGMPEAVAAGFIAISLYGLARGLESEQIRWYTVAGFTALMAYMMFISAVLYGVIVAIFLYIRHIQSDKNVYHLIPQTSFWAFSILPGIVGVIYLIYGPLETMIRTGGISKVSLFIDPTAYGLLEKAGRYFSYTYFDFWWHTRGFDTEVGIIPTITSLSNFFGSLSLVYFSGWIVITGILSLIILYGLVLLIRQRKPTGLLIFSIVLIYVVAFNYRNMGWAGAFQTRHVFPVFPAICVCFGIGAAQVIAKYDKRSLSSILPSELPNMKLVLNVTAILLLTVLVLNGGVQALILAEKVDEGRETPVVAVDSIVDDEETVGVVRNRAYHDTLIYTNGRIRPTILYEGNNSDLGKFTTELSTYQNVNSGNISSFDVDYIYFRVEYEYIDRLVYHIDVDRQFTDDIRQEGTVVYHQKIESGAFRTTDTEIFLIRLDNK